MKSHNTSSPPRLAALLLGAALLGLMSQSALAAGTASGTTISNLATLSYSVGSVSQTNIGSSSTGNTAGAGTATTFVVDNKVNLTVAKVADLTTIPGTTKQALRFTVTNNGNTTQRYALTAVTGAATITSMTNVAIYRDNGATPGVWDNTDTLYSDASTFGDVAADGSLNILIVADTPASATNAQTAIFDLRAQTVDAGTTTVTTQTATADTAGVDVVFADIAASGTDGANDIARDGKHSTSATYTIGTSILSVKKTVTVLCDPFNGSSNPKNIPGAVVQYAITISNGATASSSATLSSVTDSLPGTLAWDPKLISGVGTATPATTCTSAGGVQLSATTGFSAVRGTGTTTTSYASPGTTGQATTAGATHSAGTVTINFATLAGTAYGSADAVLPANSYVTVYFNAIVQ